MINPNNYKQLAETLEEIIELPVSEEDVKSITEKQRNYLTVLINQWGQGKEVIDTIKSILNKRSIYAPRI
jgi:pimeloyl-CoA synthetase